MTVHVSLEANDVGAEALEEEINALTGSLTAKQQEFITHYLRHRNATSAYRHAYDVSKSKYNTFRRNAHTLIKSPIMQEIIALYGRRTTLTTRITQKEVARAWWTIANTPISDVVKVHVPPCRHCHGMNHDFQWKTEREFREALGHAIAKLCVGLTGGDAADMAAAIHAGTIADPSVPSCDGGFGFNTRLAPRSECPECNGHGDKPILEITDTALLSPAASMMIQGIRQTAHGIEVNFVDRVKAIENLAKYLGMFATPLVDETQNPLERLARRLMAEAQSVPVVPDEDLPPEHVYLDADGQQLGASFIGFARDDLDDDEYVEP